MTLKAEHVEAARADAGIDADRLCQAVGPVTGIMRDLVDFIPVPGGFLKFLFRGIVRGAIEALIIAFEAWASRRCGADIPPIGGQT